MRRGTAAALLLLFAAVPALPPALAAEPPDGELVLEINDYRLTRREFDALVAAAPHAGGALPGAEGRRARLQAIERERLLALYAERHVMRGERFWEAASRNVRSRALADGWLGKRLAGTRGGDGRKAEALRLVGELERKAGVRRNLPLLKDGVPPPDGAVAAVAGGEEIPFLRVRAMAAGDYRGWRDGAAGESEEELREALDDLIRLDLVAAEAVREGGGGAGEYAGAVAEAQRAFEASVAVGKCRYDSELPDPALDNLLAAIRPAGEYLPLRVMVVRGASEADVRDFSLEVQGIRTGSKGVGGRVETVRQDGVREFWPRKGFLPGPLEEALREDVPPGKFTKVVPDGGGFVVARVLERAPYPEEAVAAEREREVRSFRERKFRRLVDEMLAKARAENRVRIWPDRI